MMAEYLHARLVRGGFLHRIQDVEVLRGKYLPEEQSRDICGQLIRDLGRRGKYLIFYLERGLLLGHNAMSGFWDLAEDPWAFDYVEGKRFPTESDVRVNITLRPDVPFFPQMKRLRFHDSRLFGSLQYWPDIKRIEDIPKIGKLGPEAIQTRHSSVVDVKWTSLDLHSSISKRPHKEIKEIMMDQHEVSGIGNIYATEALYRARVSPWKIGQDISDEDVWNILLEVQKVMTFSLGCNVRYREFLRCYRQEECDVCESSIEKAKLAGRSTYFCRKCQDVR